MKEEKKTASATASSVIPIITPSFNIELVDDDDLPTLPQELLLPLPTIAETNTAPEMKNSSNSYYNLFVLPDYELKMKKGRVSTNASWQELQHDDDDVGTGDVPTSTVTLHHHQQQSSPCIDSSSSSNKDEGAAAAAATTPNKEHEQGVAPERGLNLLEDMDHDDNLSSSVDTTIYEDWHGQAYDYSLRKKVVMNMYKALITDFQNKNKYSDEWKRKLPQLVHRLESMHYQKSPTREVYLDIKPKNMKNSLKRLAKSI